MAVVETKITHNLSASVPAVPSSISSLSARYLLFAAIAKIIFSGELSLICSAQYFVNSSKDYLRVISYTKTAALASL